VGSKPGKIDLYVGKVCVEKDIDFNEADDRLVELIKNHGRWIDPR
jgi:(E)-4-hydroxy-3-methylbut-2-enyl-diphosphate synthase